MTDEREEMNALLMGFMDGELSPPEMARVNDALMRDASLRAEYEELCRACGKLERLGAEAADETELKRIWKSPYRSSVRNVAWALILCGFVALAGYAAYAFLFLSGEAPLVRTAIAAMGIGFFLLLGLAVYERSTTYSKDPYKDIEK